MSVRVLPIKLDENGVTDAETLDLYRDFMAVDTSLFQGMPVAGPWFEARMKVLLRKWLSERDVLISGPSQLFSPTFPNLRSRSWDIVVHRSPSIALPPAASVEAGFPLVPASDAMLVIDTKTNFSDPATYARQTAFNLMNDSTILQTDVIGSAVEKMVLAISSSRSPDSMRDAGKLAGIQCFSLARYTARPVAHGAERVMSRRLELLSDGMVPLQSFKTAVRKAVEGIWSI